MTPAEFLALPIVKECPAELGTNNDGRMLNGCYFQHVPEIECDRKVTAESNTRVKIKWAAFRRSDPRRFWAIGSVWITAEVAGDDKPVMIIRNAGREGDDSSQRYIIDPEAYIEMVAYLWSIAMYVGPKRTLEDQAYALNTDIPELTEFYGDKL
jgi:hypothetical protein